MFLLLIFKVVGKMSYELLHLATEDEYRAKYIEVYCNFSKLIVTFDGITVKFFPDMFEHAFFESRNWKLSDKSIFSSVRAERMLWIKDTLTDPTALLYQGWDKIEKKYKNRNRVAVVKDDYVVVIWLQSKTTAKFITAYKADNSIGKIQAGPAWIP